MSNPDAQFQLEQWWVDLYRSNGQAHAQLLRKSDRVSSDSALRRFINAEAFRLFKRAQEEMLQPRSGNMCESGSYVLKLLESMEGLALSHLIISAALNHLLGSKSAETTLAAVGGSLVHAVEVELRIRFIEAVHPQLASAWAKADGTFHHRNKALFAIAGRGSVAGLPKFFDSRHTRNKLAMALSEMLLLASKMFEPYLAWRGKQRIWCIRVREHIIEAFNRTQDLDAFLSFVPPLGLYLEPQPVSREESDGYLLQRRPLVFNNWMRGYTNIKVESPYTVAAITKLNNVGYSINTEMLNWIRTHEKMLSARGLIPKMERVFTESCNRGEVWKQWNKDATKRRVYRRTMDLATRLTGKTFYHDWSLDFRGRMYTTSALLSPQGSPLNKALICFDETVEVSYPGMASDSSAYHEFMDYGYRMVWGKRADGDWVTVGTLSDNAFMGTLDPSLLNDEKDYLPFVAWSLEYHKLRKYDTIQTGLMLRRDATASSIQHMATMARDEKLMRMVNLSPVKETQPQDLYTQLNAGSLNRKSIKSFVMTYCYNSTAYGRAKERLKRGDNGTLKGFIREDKGVEESLAPMLSKVAEVRDGLIKYGTDNNWSFTSPSGVEWCGIKYEWPTTQIWVRYNNARIRVRMKTDNGEPDANLRKTESAYVANVIHSLDAAMLHLAVDDYPDSIAFIHDCVVTLPGHMDTAVSSLRSTFFEMHKKLPNFVINSIDIDEPLSYDEYIENSNYMFI